MIFAARNGVCNMLTDLEVVESNAVRIIVAISAGGKQKASHDDAVTTTNGGVH